MFEYFLKFGLLAMAVVLAVSAIGWYLAPEDEPGHVDVIVAVSGGDTTARAEKAISLYKQGWADRILFSGAAKDPLSPSNAEVMRRLAQETGVPINVIDIEEEAANTQENAELVAEYMSQKNFSSLILVTSPYHQRRAYLEFKKALGPNAEIINQPAIDQHWRKSSWWFSPYGWYITTSEMLKLPFTSFQ